MLNEDDYLLGDDDRMDCSETGKNLNLHNLLDYDNLDNGFTKNNTNKTIVNTIVSEKSSVNSQTSYQNILDSSKSDFNSPNKYTLSQSTPTSSKFAKNNIFTSKVSRSGEKKNSNFNAMKSKMLDILDQGKIIMLRFDWQVQNNQKKVLELVLAEYKKVNGPVDSNHIPLADRRKFMGFLLDVYTENIPITMRKTDNAAAVFLEIVCEELDIQKNLFNPLHFTRALNQRVQRNRPSTLKEDLINPAEKTLVASIDKCSKFKTAGEYVFKILSYDDPKTYFVNNYQHMYYHLLSQKSTFNVENISLGLAKIKNIFGKSKECILENSILNMCNKYGLKNPILNVSDNIPGTTGVYCSLYNPLETTTYYFFVGQFMFTESKNLEDIILSFLMFNAICKNMKILEPFKSLWFLLGIYANENLEFFLKGRSEIPNHIKKVYDFYKLSENSE
uniref:Rab-GAP TBC domain-containing protein n=1 Tax=Strongyloides papillosus TaxID=174720 RepID=A0A0N5BBN9_STREA